LAFTGAGALGGMFGAGFACVLVGVGFLIATRRRRASGRT